MSFRFDFRESSAIKLSPNSNQSNICWRDVGTRYEKWCYSHSVSLREASFSPSLLATLPHVSHFGCFHFHPHHEYEMCLMFSFWNCQKFDRKYILHLCVTDNERGTWVIFEIWLLLAYGQLGHEKSQFGSPFPGTKIYISSWKMCDVEIGVQYGDNLNLLDFNPRGQHIWSQNESSHQDWEPEPWGGCLTELFFW